MVLVKIARAIATPVLPLMGGGRGNALDTLGDEWNGFSLDFISNTYAMRRSVSSELLLGSGPNRADTGIGVDFTANNYAIGV